MPLSIHFFCKDLTLTLSCISKTPIAPITLKSLTSLFFEIFSKDLNILFSIFLIFFFQSYERSRLIFASATEHASGLAIYVGPCIKTPGA